MIEFWLWVPFLITPIVGVAFLYESRQLPRNRAFLFIGLALLVSFLCSTGQLILVELGRTNVLIQFAWPLLTSTLLLFGLARMTSDAMAMTGMILILALVTSLGVTDTQEILKIGAQLRILAAVFVVGMLWRGSHYHRTGLEPGIWFYYLLPAPALYAGLADPDVAVPVWVFSRVCQLAGLASLGGWLWWRRNPGLHRRLQSSSGSSVASPGASPGPWTTSAPNSSKSAKPVEPWRGSTI